MDDVIGGLRRGLVMSVILLGTTPSVPLAGAAEPIHVKVVANQSVPTGIVSKRTLNAVFRGEPARWSDGTLLRAVDQSVRSEIRFAFTRDFLNDTLDGIQTQWMRRIAQGHGLPPPVKSSDAEVLAFVAGTRGALGYVLESTPLPAAVKAVQVVD